MTSLGNDRVSQRKPSSVAALFQFAHAALANFRHFFPDAFCLLRRGSTQPAAVTHYNMEAQGETMLFQAAPHDALRLGLPALKEGVLPKHPVELIQQDSRTNVSAMCRELWVQGLQRQVHAVRWGAAETCYVHC